MYLSYLLMVFKFVFKKSTFWTFYNCNIKRIYYKQEDKKSLEILKNYLVKYQSYRMNLQSKSYFLRKEYYTNPPTKIRVYCNINIYIWIYIYIKFICYFSICNNLLLSLVVFHYNYENYWENRTIMIFIKYQLKWIFYKKALLEIYNT